MSEEIDISTDGRSFAETERWKDGLETLRHNGAYSLSRGRPWRRSRPSLTTLPHRPIDCRSAITAACWLSHSDSLLGKVSELTSLNLLNLPLLLRNCLSDGQRVDQVGSCLLKSVMGSRKQAKSKFIQDRFILDLCPISSDLQQFWPPQSDVCDKLAQCPPM